MGTSVHAIGTTSFQIDCDNSTGGQQTFIIQWIALGH
jgi:hypothetical protein